VGPATWVVHGQQVLTHPGASLSVGHPSADASADPTARIEARLNGVARGLTTRILTGRGWAVAAMTTPGGLGALISTSAADFTDRIVALGPAIGADEVALLRHVVVQPDEMSRVAALAAFLEQALKPQRTASARQVAEVAKLAETNRGVRRLSQLCATAGIGQRSLQRLFLAAHARSRTRHPGRCPPRADSAAQRARPQHHPDRARPRAGRARSTVPRCGLVARPVSSRAGGAVDRPGVEPCAHRVVPGSAAAT